MVGVAWGWAQTTAKARMEQQSNTHFWAGNGTHGVGSIAHEVTAAGERYHGGSRAEVCLHSMEGNQQERENERERENCMREVMSNASSENGQLQEKTLWRHRICSAGCIR